MIYKQIYKEQIKEAKFQYYMSQQFECNYKYIGIYVL